MTGPAIYVIDAAEWNAMASALANIIFLLLAAVYAAGIDWWRLHDLVRLHLRRRRLRAIRRSRASAQA